MKSRTVLIILLVLVLGALYYVLRHAKNHNKHGKTGLLGVPDAVESKNPCDFLASQNFSTGVVEGCNQYGKVCGQASNFEHVLAFSQNFDPFDSNTEDAMRADVAYATQDHNKCSKPAVCGSSSDCKPMDTDFGLSCKNIVCHNDDCQPGEECTPQKICMGACL